MGLYGSPDVGNLYTNPKEHKEPKKPKKNIYKLLWVLVALNVIVLALTEVTKDHILTLIFADSIIVFIVSIIGLIYNGVKKNSIQKNLLFIVLSIVIGLLSAFNMEPIDTVDGISDINNVENEQIGQRKNPAKIGDIVSLDVIDSDGLTFTIEVELLETKRGENAKELIETINDFSGGPGQDKEYMFAKFRVKNIKNKSSEDSPLHLSWNYFNYATSDYKKYTNSALISGPDILDTVELYEGAEHIAWVCLYIKKDDPNPKIVFLDGEGVWFDL
ncbi:hypothetical protein [Tepidimicrobium xylanilyticum]|uniref:hypothetical protein n=1 Tax=Tepidimicrobium xylanilyticum TaxID=1123352 RepID=UPI002656B034|nr:hypothetical protein [Tepidimicrobium xylanilyticum]GMG96858.1 hypothetical protein EN5CB1_16840 [Tepidimicrobium xylanilyticum]